MSPRKRSGRVARLILWGGLGTWAMALAAFYLLRPPPAASQPGDVVLDAGVMGRSVGGGELPILPRGDSVVAVLAATSECAACRVGIPGYRELAARLRDEGVALRVIVGSDSMAARQFARLLPQPGAVIWDPRQELFRSIGMRKVPSLFLVGPDGRLLKTWVPLTPDAEVVEVVGLAARQAKAGR